MHEIKRSDDDLWGAEQTALPNDHLCLQAVEDLNCTTRTGRLSPIKQLGRGGPNGKAEKGQCFRCQGYSDHFGEKLHLSSGVMKQGELVAAGSSWWHHTALMVKWGKDAHCWPSVRGSM